MGKTIAMAFAKTLINWYTTYKRDLPWRHTTKPYLIWLSEIMLQQTQVKQAMPYYLKFVERFPKVQDLAEANEDEILKMWQGLGYYSRARNLHYTAKDIANNYNGEFPNSYKDLLKLKGVGEYTAAAIASFAYNEATPVVDGNVYRVLSRIFGIDTPINSTEGVKRFKQKANELIDHTQPSTYNQAIMEFGAIQCTPKSPNCLFCPFIETCVAYQQAKVEYLPFKLKKTKVKTRYFNYLIIEDNTGNLLLNKRTQKGIWQNMYEFILSDTSQALKAFPLDKFQLDDILNPSQLELINPNPITHILSHRKLLVTFWYAQLQGSFSEDIAKNYELASRENLQEYAVPVLIQNFMQEYIFKA